MKKSKKIISMLLVVALMVSVFCAQGSVETEAKTFKKTGGYSTSLSTKRDKSNEYYSFAKKLVFKGSTFTLYGSMHYTRPGDVYSTKIYKKAKRTYVISSSCKFYKVTFKNGKLKRKKISKKKLKKYALPLDKGSYSKRSLAWDIKGGKVVELEYREY